MPYYVCPVCSSVMEFNPALGKKRQNCKFCPSGTIDRHDQASGYTAEQNTYQAPGQSPAKRRTGAPGRAVAAPNPTVWPLVPPPHMHTDVVYVANLQLPAWAARNDAMRLAYKHLNLGTPELQGLVIALPELAADPVAQQHFASVTSQLEAAHSSARITEATGEAAAAMAVLKHYPGFRMQWGMHCHSGAGLDQIWTLAAAGANPAEVLIVEAKGPGAGLSDNSFMPPDFDQMSANWIVHNLATMMSAARGSTATAMVQQGTLASGIVNGLGLTVGATYPVYGGSSKTYYGVTGNSGPRTIRVRRLVVTADWEADGRLVGRRVTLPDLGAIAPAPTRFHAEAHRRYPGSVPSVPAPVTYP